MIADYLYLPDTKRSVLVRVIAFGAGPLAQTVNKIHDFLSLRSTFRNRIEKTEVQINLLLRHVRLLLVQPLFELFRRQPVRGVLVREPSFNGLLINRVGPMPKMEKKAAYFVLFCGRQCRQRAL